MGEGDIDIGPAAGLPAAHGHNADAHWLVLTCDYSFVTVEALRQLYEELEEPVACFVNRDRVAEPLVAAWAQRRRRGSRGGQSLFPSSRRQVVRSEAM